MTAMSFNQEMIFMGIFNLFVLIMLVLDLKVFHRNEHEVSVKEALLASAFWIGLALIFNAGVYWKLGHDAGLQFLTGYLIEKSLSVDNLFVFLLIFSFFRVPAKYQHTILFWGILGALIMRALLILVGAALIHAFHWVIYVFGAFLVFTGFKLAFQKEDGVHPEKNPIIRLAKKVFAVTHEYHGKKFFVHIGNKLHATPLFIVLLVVETTDVVFALDSIPAIFGVTKDPFIVYTSNVFAILGLRALYFALAGVMKYFHFLKIGLSVILVFVGIKMLIEHYYKIPIGASLGVIGGILALSIVVSILFPKKEE